MSLRPWNAVPLVLVVAVWEGNTQLPFEEVVSPLPLRETAAVP